MNNQGLTTLLETIWQQLGRGTSDRHHPARHPTLATLGSNGPEVRTLVLRAIDRESQTLEFHTDAASPKAAQIAANPQVALHIWIPKSRLQIRARGAARIEQGDPQLFAQLPPRAQANYTGAIPGTPLSEKTPETDPRFARLLCEMSEIDALLLTDPHQRALFRASDAWQGQWIAP